MRGAAPLDAALDGALRPVARRLRSGRMMRGGALGLGAGALMAAAGAPVVAGLALGALGAAIGGLWPPDARRVVQRLDAAAGLDGALRCAWDHRDDDRPLARAQREQAREALEVARAAGGARGPDRRAAPSPAAGWLLGPALWILPFVAPPNPVGPVDGGAGDAEAPITAGGALPAQPPEPAAPAPTVSPIDDDAKARAQADPLEVEPDAGDEADAAPARDGGPPEAADGGVGDPRLTAGGAAGQQAGERGGGSAGAAPVEARAGEGPALVLPAAAGAFDRGSGPVGRLVVGRSPPPPDAIADPARPYPSRYRRAIAAWFDRSAP